MGWFNEGDGRVYVIVYMVVIGSFIVGFCCDFMRDMKLLGGVW